MMKKINLDYLMELQQNTQYLKNLANELANQLIIEFDINEGYQFAYFLKTNIGLDNYMAIRVWIQKTLNEYYPLAGDINFLKDLQQDDTLYNRIKSEFLTHFPETAIA